MSSDACAWDLRRNSFGLIGGELICKSKRAQGSARKRNDTGFHARLVLWPPAPHKAGRSADLLQIWMHFHAANPKCILHQLHPLFMPARSPVAATSGSSDVAKPILCSEGASVNPQSCNDPIIMPNEHDTFLKLY